MSRRFPWLGPRWCPHAALSLPTLHWSERRGPTLAVTQSSPVTTSLLSPDQVTSTQSNKCCDTQALRSSSQPSRQVSHFQYMQVWTGINSYYLVQIYAILVWINTKLVWNHTIELWNLGFKSFPKNSVRNWMIKCETIFSISPLLAVLLIKRSENHFLSGPTRYEFILHWYEFIPAWYIFSFCQWEGESTELLRIRNVLF